MRTRGYGALVGVAALIALALAALSTGHAAAVACSGWNLYNDFNTSTPTNPNPDSCGNPAVWYFDKSTAAVHDPTNYVGLDTYTNNFSGATGLDGWYNSGDTNTQTPHVLKNTNSTATTFLTVTVPANSIDVHPGSEANATDGYYVVVGWKSPITGSVDIAGGVSDNDNTCGDGIAWSIDTYKGATNTTLTSGAYANGGSQTFASGSGGPSSISGVSVSTGDYIYFVIDPQATYYCDSTDLDVTISPTAQTGVPEAPLGVAAIAGVGVIAVTSWWRRRSRAAR